MGYTLTSSASSPVVAASTTAWSVQLVVTSDDAEKYPPKCLVFQAEDPGNLQTRAWFTNVASPSQLQEYPEDEVTLAASGDVQVPYYRLDTVQLIGRSPDEIQLLILQFAEELTNLQRNLDALDILSESQTIPIV